MFRLFLSNGLVSELLVLSNLVIRVAGEVNAMVRVLTIEDVTILVSRLRRKLAVHMPNARIETISRYGYRLTFLVA